MDARIGSMMGRQKRGTFCFSGMLAAVLIAALAAVPGQVSARESVTVPSFADPNKRVSKPDMTNLRTIRFLTELESPPFSFRAEDGELTGFNVDLARAICVELDVLCTIQSLRWDLLLDGLESGRGDAIIAALPITSSTRTRYWFSNRFLAFPARFIARHGEEPEQIGPSALAGRSIAVVRDTAHEAFLRDFFSGAALYRYATLDDARRALKAGDVSLLFADGMTMSFWLNGTVSEGCCTFTGGPYAESRYFGEGMAIAMRPGDAELHDAIDVALSRIQRDQIYLEIFLRYFPIGFF